MASMFQGASAFDHDISAWDVGMETNCTDISDNNLSGWTADKKPSFTSCTP